MERRIADIIISGVVHDIGNGKAKVLGIEKGCGQIIMGTVRACIARYLDQEVGDDGLPIIGGGVGILDERNALDQAADWPRQRTLGFFAVWWCDVLGEKKSDRIPRVTDWVRAESVDVLGVVD